MFIRLLSTLALVSTFFISTTANALLLSFADINGGTVPGTTISYTVTSTSNGDVAIPAGGTGDGDHTWAAGGTTLRQTGGDWSAAINFSDPVAANKLTFVFIDVDNTSPSIEFSVTGDADTQDFAIDPGYVSGALEFDFNSLTGILTAPTDPPDAIGYHSQLFGTSLDEVLSMSFFTTGVTGGDYTAARFGFVVPDDTPPPAVIPVPAAVWFFGSAILGFAGFNRFKKKS